MARGILFDWPGFGFAHMVESPDSFIASEASTESVSGTWVSEIRLSKLHPSAGVFERYHHIIIR